MRWMMPSRVDRSRTECSIATSSVFQKWKARGPWSVSLTSRSPSANSPPQAAAARIRASSAAQRGAKYPQADADDTNATGVEIVTCLNRVDHRRASLFPFDDAGLVLPDLALAGTVEGEGGQAATQDDVFEGRVLFLRRVQARDKQHDGRLVDTRRLAQISRQLRFTKRHLQEGRGW